jgi:hypothetical protein
MSEYNYTLDENQWPLIPECNKVAFWKYYPTAESMAIFDSLYSNKFGLQDNFVKFWEIVANRLSKNKFVVGFDPINEPFPSDFIDNPDLLKPGVFDD